MEPLLLSASRSKKIEEQEIFNNDTQVRIQKNLVRWTPENTRREEKIQAVKFSDEPSE